MTIRCAIIEDEPLGVKTLKILLKNFPEVAVVRTGRSLKDAVEIFSDDSIDLFFSDIELLDGNVFEALSVASPQKGQYIVFTTAYEQFGAKAFNYPALHYLMKPILKCIK